MTTLENNNYAKIIFNGSTTYSVVSIDGSDCYFGSSSERKAKNYLKKMLTAAGIIK